MTTARHFFIIFILVIFSLTWRNAAADEVLTIGVLAQRSVQEDQRRWQHLADYLNEKMPEHHIQIQVFDYAGIEQALQQHKLHFLLTNPAHFFMLQKSMALSGSLVTLVERAEEKPVNAVGGVIFTLADRNDLSQLKDLDNQIIAVCALACMEGYQLQVEMFLDAGLAPPAKKNMLLLGLPQDNVAEAVLSGQADVGFIRAGVLEQMAQEGRFDFSRIKIINRQDLPGFPYAVSTRLYPQWPVIALPGADASSARRLVAALLRIESKTSLSDAIGIHGFTTPANYAVIDILARKLHLPPYDTVQKVSLIEVWESYRWLIIAVFITIVLILDLMIGLIISTRRLKKAQKFGDEQNQALNSAYAQVRTLVETIPDLIWLKDSEGVFLQCNPQFEKLFGTPESEIIGKTDYDFVAKERADYFRQKDKEAAAAGKPCINEEWVTFASDDRKVLLETIKTPMFDASGQLVGVLGIGRDITQRHLNEEKLRFFACIIESAAEAFMITDIDGTIVSVNQAFTTITGYSKKEAVGQTPAMLNSGFQDEDFYRKMWAGIRGEGFWEGEIWDRRKDGKVYPKWLRITTVQNTDDEITHYVGNFSDISDKKYAEEQIHRLAFFDPLTSLPNRRLLMDRFDHALLASNRSNRYGALLLLDLDHFKILNDTLGHVIGDQLLIEVGQRLISSVREVDTVSRLGGDEFVVLIEELGCDESMVATGVEKVAEKIRGQFTHPFLLDGETSIYQTTVSIGITLFMGQSTPVSTLLKQADMALYQAKDAGRDAIRFFNPGMQADIESRTALEKAMRYGLAQNEFSLFYQPVVDFNGKCTGAEALLRWTSREYGPVSPVNFIPLAETTGLIIPIGDWVLKTACAQLKAWQDNPATSHFILAVNISANQFRQSNFEAWVKQVLLDSGANPEYLTIELTESAVLYDVEEAVARMTSIKEMGVNFSLDDFGTGYSSLSYLKKLPVDTVKIDRSFVMDVPGDKNDVAIVLAILSMSEALDLSVVAEGVETDQQYAYLRQYGCPFFQGYLFGRPMPAEEFMAYINEV
ncbi:MAG: EAL domain-containing protein [Gammaproteobacteria bacterium]|nr:EAL domain-containing protein [Gammaproteobacteria bacterium]